MRDELEIDARVAGAPAGVGARTERGVEAMLDLATAGMAGKLWGELNQWAGFPGSNRWLKTKAAMGKPRRVCGIHAERQPRDNPK